MKKLLLFIFFMSVLAINAQSGFNYTKDFKTILRKTKKSKDRLFYDKLLKRFTSNDTTLRDFEVLALMIGFTDKPEYKPYDDLRTERVIYDLNDAGKFKDALDSANRFLKMHPLSQAALIEKSFSFYKLEMPDSANYYLYQFRRIMRAMDFSGNGKDIPMFSLGPADGQNYIRKYLAAQIGTMGSGEDKHGNFIDILEANYKDGTSEKLNFVIQHAVGKMFGGHSLKKELRLQKKKKRDK